MKRTNDIHLQKNLITDLILRGKIITTKPKAKSIVGLTDRLITQLKKNSAASKLKVLKFFGKEALVIKLEKEILPQLSGRISGYTRLLKIKERSGDNALLVRMEWVTDKREQEEKPSPVRRGPASPAKRGEQGEVKEEKKPEKNSYEND